MTQALEVVDQATVNAREQERDRRAWNLPRAPVGSDVADEILPENLSQLDREELRKASDTRDKRLSVLFHRWPSLSKMEMKEIRRLNDERQRLARYVGALRKRRRAESGETRQEPS